jgi:hypothetical protein
MSHPSPEPAVAALSYANPRIEKPSLSLYRTVLVLGAAPMVLGGLTLLICWAMRWGWWGDYTTLVAVISGALIIAASVQLIIFALREQRYRRLSGVALQVRLLLGVLLVASNFPVLWLYQDAPRKMTRRSTVTVINNGRATIDRFVVKNAGVNTDMGPVAPGATVKGTFDVPMTAWLSYEAWQTTANSRSMSGGSLPGRRGDHTITMNPSGMTIK